MDRGLMIDAGRVLPLPSAPSLWSVRGLLGWRPLVRKCLADAREQIDDLENEAAEEGLPPPSPRAKELVAGLIEKIVPAFPRYYAISAGADGDVAIEANGALGYRVGVFFDADGGTSMFVIHPQGCIYECRYRPPATIGAEEIVAAMKSLKPKS